MEHWHPNPDFFFQPGGGPILDLGPYYIANLIQLIGPVKRVAALATIPATERTITSKPRNGEKIPVDTPTTIHALLEFENGAVVTLQRQLGRLGARPCADGALWRGRHDLRARPELLRRRRCASPSSGKPVKKVPKWEHPFGVPNQKHAPRHDGQLPHGRAGRHGARDHRRTGRTAARWTLALHAVDVMTGILKSGETGQFVDMQTTCERPAALGIREAKALLAKAA